MPRLLTLEPLPSTQRQLSLSPDVGEKLKQFVARNEFLVETIGQMPREKLEQQLLLDRMVLEEIKLHLSNKLDSLINPEPEVTQTLQHDNSRPANQLSQGLAR